MRLWTHFLPHPSEQKPTQMSAGKRRLRYLAPLAAAVSCSLQNVAFCGTALRLLPSRLERHRLQALDKDPLSQLGRITGSRGPRNPDPAAAEGGAVAGGIGGAVLGGLVLGPFGAIFGAQLGSRFGRAKAQEQVSDGEELGLDAEMVSLARRVASELSTAMDDRDRVQEVRDELQMKAQRLEDEVREKYDQAAEALKNDNEAEARRLLEQKLSSQSKLERALKDLQKAEERCALMHRSVKQLEKRATEVASLLERAQVAAGRQRMSLTAKASALGMSAPRDPLLEKFEALERGER